MTQPKDTVAKVALVGAGMIARPHLRGLKNLGAQVKVYALEGAQDLVAEVGWGQVAGSLEEAVADADLVDIVTPTPTHHDVALRCLQSGKNVVVEKPLARTAAEALELKEAATSNNAHLFVAHVVRFFPAYVALHQAVEQGRIGQVAVARFTRTGAYPTWAPWFADAEASGGVIFDLMVHDIDIARWVCGEVTRVHATLVRHDDQQIAQLVLNHDGGALSYIRGAWGAPGIPFTTTFNVSGDAGVLRFDSAAGTDFLLHNASYLEGTRAKRDTSLGQKCADREGTDQKSTGHASAAASDTAADTAAGTSPYQSELAEFLGAVSGGQEPGRKKPRITVDDGIAALQIAEAATQSVATGQPVFLQATPKGAQS